MNLKVNFLLISAMLATVLAYGCGPAKRNPPKKPNLAIKGHTELTKKELNELDGIGDKKIGELEHHESSGVEKIIKKKIASVKPEVASERVRYMLESLAANGDMEGSKKEIAEWVNSYEQIISEIKTWAENANIISDLNKAIDVIQTEFASHQIPGLQGQEEIIKGVVATLKNVLADATPKDLSVGIDMILGIATLTFIKDDTAMDEQSLLNAVMSYFEGFKNKFSPEFLQNLNLEDLMKSLKNHL